MKLELRNKKVEVRNVNSKISKFFLLSFIIFSFVSASFAQASKASLREQAALVTELDVNGLKVLVKRRPNSPTVAAGLFVRGGARNITAQNAGIENLTLEVAAEGSKKYPRETLRRELAETGSEVGANSGNDYSVLSLATTRENFDRSWNIFTDIALNPTFQAEDIARVRDRISTGLRERETDNDNYLQILQDRLIYTKHPYGNDVGGNLETIGKFTPKELSDYHKKIMQTSQLLLVIVGDLDANDVKNKVAATLGKLPVGNYKNTPFPKLDFTKASVNVTPRTLPTNYIQGVFAAPDLNDPDYYAMRMAMTILQIRIFQEVRNKRQLSYAPSADLESFASNTAKIYVTAVKANEAVRVMLDEVNNMKTQLLPPPALSSISGQFLTLHYLDQETNAAQAREIAKYELIGGGWQNAFDFLEKIRKITPQDVQTVSKKYMKNIRFVVIGDPKAIDEKIFLQN